MYLVSANEKPNYCYEGKRKVALPTRKIKHTLGSLRLSGRSNHLLQVLVAISVSSFILGAMSEQGGPEIKWLPLLRRIQSVRG